MRFDAVYVGHFKCNQRRIADYPNLSNYLRDLYAASGRRADREPLPHQAALLREPSDHQSDADRAARPGSGLRGPERPRACASGESSAARLRTLDGRAERLVRGLNRRNPDPP